MSILTWKVKCFIFVFLLGLAFFFIYINKEYVSLEESDYHVICDFTKKGKIKIRLSNDLELRTLKKYDLGRCVFLKAIQGPIYIMYEKSDFVINELRIGSQLVVKKNEIFSFYIFGYFFFSLTIFLIFYRYGKRKEQKALRKK